MRTVLDTNILIAHQNEQDLNHQTVKNRILALANEGDELHIPPQVLFEFWVVATRPIRANGLGLSPPEARKQIGLCRDAYRLLHDPETILDGWLDLCTRYNVSGRQAHDARIVAWMIGHGITRLMTLNQGDFSRYREIEAVSPLGS